MQHDTQALKSFHAVTPSRIARAVSAALLIAAALSAVTSAQAVATCPFDTGGSDLANDGVVLTRFALGITGAPLIASTKFASIAGFTGAQAQANIECTACGLDMDGNGQINTVDTTIIARHLAGFSGASLTNGLGLSASAVTAVNSFIVNGCSVGGAVNAFVQGGNSFGAPAVLGTNDVQPLTVQSGGTATSVLTQGGDGLRLKSVLGISFGGAFGSVNVISGSRENTIVANVQGATIAGGGSFEGINTSGEFRYPNTVNGDFGSVGGGRANQAANFATVSGGAQNNASNFYSAIAGGVSNTASGESSFVAGGSQNSAAGTNSFAGGTQAKASRAGQFMWADSNGLDFKVQVSELAGLPGSSGWGDATNTFNVRATGGVWFVTSVSAQGRPTTGPYASSGSGTWAATSDRNQKKDITAIKPKDVLAKVMALPLSTWRYLAETGNPIHMGPMAQDFKRLFGLGSDERSITGIDADGVALAAIQGLNQKLTDEVKTLRTRLSSKDEEAAKLKVRLAAIEKKLGLN